MLNLSFCQFRRVQNSDCTKTGFFFLLRMCLWFPFAVVASKRRNVQYIVLLSRNIPYIKNLVPRTDMTAPERTRGEVISYWLGCTCLTAPAISQCKSLELAGRFGLGGSCLAITWEGWRGRPKSQRKCVTEVDANKLRHGRFDWERVYA